MKKIIILEGGYNEEHEISLNTSKAIQRSLQKMNLIYDVILVDPEKIINQLNSFQDNKFIIFNALHGPFGEDGKIQKILEEKNIVFTHSGSSTSSIAFDKGLTKLTIKGRGIPFLESKLINKSNLNKDNLENFFKEFNSFVIKPISSGSSYGVKMFFSFDDIKNFQLNYKKEIKVYKNHEKLMVEKFVKGRELTVGVFENKQKLEALAVTEIISKNPFYDYDAKYVQGMSKHILPADLPKKIYDKCLDYARIVHEKLECRGISRSDFIYDGKNIFFLEINTQPGLTETSLIPEQLKFREINFDIFVREIIENSL